MNPKKAARIILDAMKVADRMPIILLDQFEQIFVDFDNSSFFAIAEFLRTILHDETIRSHVLISIREDYFVRLNDLTDYIPGVFNNRYNLILLKLPFAEHAIRGPAKVVGLQCDDDFIHTVLRDLDRKGIEPPQLQIVCTAVFNALPPQSKNIDLSIYEELGRAEKILSDYVGYVLSSFRDNDRDVAREILKCFVSPSRTRATLTDKALINHLNSKYDEDQIKSVLDTLIFHRLVRIAKRESASVLELSHDYLIPQIDKWISTEEREIRRMREVMEYERHICRNLETLIPLKRALFLKLQVDKANFDPIDRKLIEKSIKKGELEEKERKQADEALRESEEKFRTFMETASDLIHMMDKDGNFTYVNESMARTLGYPKEEMRGMHISQVMNEETTKDFDRLWEELVTKGKFTHEFTWMTKDGREIDGEIKVIAVYDSDGEYAGSRGIFRDLTERKRLESQLQQAQKMEAIGTLAGGIAHDFNNLLMGIQGNASLILLDKASDHADYKRLKNIQQGAQSGAELTKQLLGFAMVGKYEVKPTDLNELIKKGKRMFARTKKEITVRGKYEENLWTVEVDQGQIEQVLLNLYVNAWQAMPRGGKLSIETENVTLGEHIVKPYDLEPGNYVKISVNDTGVGMDEATKRRIFEPFFTTRGLERGTGLGLASAYGIIKGHGGFINVHSKKGEGTTMTIYLPASEKEVVKEEELPEEIVRGTETVLLVDDEDMILDVGEVVLKQLGYKVLIARGGREAMELYKKKQDKIAMVVLDMIMPEMGGGETYDRMREINPDIKVLLSSGYSIEGQGEEILERGCDGFLQKPYNMKQISHKIRQILDKE